YARIGVYICYDRHFPEGARALGLNGAEIVFNPSATVAGLSEYLWKLEQPARAVANGYFVGAINRVGHEQRCSCPARLIAPTKYPFATACAGCSNFQRYSDKPATVADGLKTISAPFSPSARAPSGKWRS